MWRTFIELKIKRDTAWVVEVCESLLLTLMYTWSGECKMDLSSSLFNNTWNIYTFIL